ncbi:MAG: GerMN domain-containing protein [Gorillibacterium sp.]|nr:GerMN domain-containing protein [Gorillibacterium sp.]
MKFGRPVRFLATVFALSLIASGCSSTKSHSKSIDPPPDEAEVMMQKALDALSEESISKDTVDVNSTALQSTVYFKDSNGFVVPVSLPMTDESKPAQRALEAMVEDGPARSMLPSGFTALLPKGTVVNSLNIDENKLATVDFSSEFTQYNGQDERKILEALTWTLTSFPTVEKVKILVGGQELPEMTELGTPLDEPLSRSMGINLEFAPGVDPGRTTPVVLYFKGTTKDNFNYYVPVTRLINRTDQVAQATVEELVKGPDIASGLMTALTSDIKVLEVNQAVDNSLVSVDFGSTFLDAEQKASAEAIQEVVLSLLETTKSAEVSLSVNGNTTIKASGDQSLTKPVAKPVHINPYKA